MKEYNIILYSHALLVQMQNDIATVKEDSLVVSHKARSNLTTSSSIGALRYLFNQIKAYVHTKACTHVYTCFIHNY